MKYGHLSFIRDNEGKVIKHEWRGPPIIEISYRDVMHMGATGATVAVGKNKITLGPYVLKRVSGEAGGWSAVYRRINGPFNVRLRSFLLSIKHLFSIINGRILMTLRVWELVETKIGCRSQWSDLRIYKWVKRLFG